MYSVQKETDAAARARWLGDLCGALDETLAALPELMLVSDARREIIELYARVEALRTQAMRLRSCDADGEFDPEWRWYGPKAARQASGQTPRGSSPPPANGSR